MATEVLRPQDILIERFRVSPSALHRRRNNYGKGNDSFNPKPSSNNNYGNRVKPERERSEKKKLKNQPEPLMRKRCTSSEDLRPTHNGVKSNGDGIVMGRVTLLRRGESLDSLNPIFTKVGPGQKPEMMVPKHIRVGLSSADVISGSAAFPKSPVYAGSAFSNSPSPRALPLPSFFNNNNKKQEDFATRDLRRLLRLEY
ncbi:uncharacterized protein LOC132053817 [Lycium ferocissimum]|uniref:uncharacterized protein LOC132053817 n=1 Tax=Lycium ferocissimum TaxID=112874 RepID=UPI002814B7E6|nr:uncharacterized protein LOC132053817 [Lycium ferocissimum]